MEKKILTLRLTVLCLGIWGAAAAYANLNSDTDLGKKSQLSREAVEQVTKGDFTAGRDHAANVFGEVIQNIKKDKPGDVKAVKKESGKTTDLPAADAAAPGSADGSHRMGYPAKTPLKSARGVPPFPENGGKNKQGAGTLPITYAVGAVGLLALAGGVYFGLRKATSVANAAVSSVCTLNQPTGNCTLNQPTGNCTLNQPTGNCTLNQPTGNCTLNQPTGNCTLNQPTGNCTLNQSAGNCTLNQPTGNCTLNQPTGNCTLNQPPNPVV